jgi:hypothetical protein
MKKVFLIIAALLIFTGINAQTNPIDELFERFSGKDGYTSVFISGRMLSMLAGKEAKAGNPDNIMFRIKSIRILTEDSLCVNKANFYTELSKKLDFSVYEELMVVRESREVTKFLIREDGNMISELLVISGGDNGNTLISIRGNLNLKELSQLSETTGIKELEQLENVDKKEPQKK